MDPKMLVAVAESVRDVFFRFGSTRLMALGMYLWFLTSQNIDTIEASLGAGALAVVLVLMMLRPHAAHKEGPK